MSMAGHLGAWDDRPRRRADVDLRAASLDSRAVFLLTRIDGSSTIADVCEMSGLPSAVAVEVLQQLLTSGLITIEKAPPKRATPQALPVAGDRPEVAPSRAAPSTSAQPPSASTHPETTPAPSALGPRRDDVLFLRKHGRLGHVPAEAWAALGEEKFARFEFDKRELLEACDLSIDQRRDVLFHYHNADNLDHFELLGIEPTDDRKKLRLGYFAFSKRFHPDAYFRRDTGQFGARLSHVFKLGTEIHDRLQGDDKLREAYARVVLARNARASELLEAERVRQAAERVRQAAELATHQQVSADANKAELQARLEATRNARRSRTDANPMAARLDKGEQYYLDGMKLYQQEKFLQAASTLQLALTFDPKNETYRQAFARVNDKAKQLRAEQVWKRGEISESIGQEREALAYFKDALAFWQRADYLNRTAELMMKLNDDLTGAAEFARQATDLAPHKVDYLLTLGKVFERASLHKRAQGVYERALKLSPQNDTVKKALKALKRL